MTDAVCDAVDAGRTRGIRSRLCCLGRAGSAVLGTGSGLSEAEPAEVGRHLGVLALELLDGREEFLPVRLDALDEVGVLEELVADVPDLHLQLQRRAVVGRVVVAEQQVDVGQESSLLADELRVLALVAVDGALGLVTGGAQLSQGLLEVPDALPVRHGGVGDVVEQVVQVAQHSDSDLVHER